MRFVIRRGAATNSLTVDNTTFDLAGMKGTEGFCRQSDSHSTKYRKSLEATARTGKTGNPILPDAVREMVVDNWALANGFSPVYVDNG